MTRGERRRAYQKSWWEAKKHDPVDRERRSEARRARYAAKGEELRAYYRAYYATRRADPVFIEQSRERHRGYYEKPRAKARNRDAKAARRARKHNQFVEAVDRAVVFDRAEGVCGICGEPIGGEFHVDHIVPLARGGLHAYGNVQPAHPRCNLRKHAKIESETNDA